MILLVEDTPSDEVLVTGALEAAGFGSDITVMRDGAAALEHIERLERREVRQLPRLVLLDLQLPKVNGLDVLRRMRATPRTRHVPVVILTSSDEDEDVLFSYSLGANAYVQKTADLTKLRSTVEALARFWLTMNITAR